MSGFSHFSSFITIRHVLPAYALTAIVTKSIKSKSMFKQCSPFSVAMLLFCTSSCYFALSIYTARRWQPRNRSRTSRSKSNLRTWSKLRNLINIHLYSKLNERCRYYQMIMNNEVHGTSYLSFTVCRLWHESSRSRVQHQHIFKCKCTRY